MRTNGKKAGIVAAALSSALLVGGGALAFADTGAPSPDKGDAKTAFKGTVEAPTEHETEDDAADGSPEEKAQDKEEASVLAKLATVTGQEATKAATDAVPGTVKSVELDDEDGFVVWEVDIAKADGTTAEVLVDAGNANVLAQQSD